ncbi:hypothetical protein [Nocardia wallacei]|uniref:hypothetical protein n=1 Tax=Nocardia wallacei TaxID=480035 RepID=UPI002458E8DA|nr:hypothetical protein [Nocardia wallacei]
MNTPERPVPVSRADLARRYNKSPSWIGRLLQRGEAAHREHPDTKPAPPRPINPGSKRELFDPDEFAAWWDATHRNVGRPRNVDGEQQ